MIKILVTGFGTFPGARHNPTAALLAALQRRPARLARLGLQLELQLLPVSYKALDRRISALLEEDTSRRHPPFRLGAPP